MEILKRDKNIALVDWSKDYPSVYHAATTVHIYPIATQGLNSEYRPFAPRANMRFLLSLNFDTAEQADEAYEDIRFNGLSERYQQYAEKQEYFKIARKGVL